MAAARTIRVTMVIVQPPRGEPGASNSVIFARWGRTIFLNSYMPSEPVLLAQTFLPVPHLHYAQSATFLEVQQISLCHQPRGFVQNKLLSANHLFPGLHCPKPTSASRQTIVNHPARFALDRHTAQRICTLMLHRLSLHGLLFFKI
jgi:hypothetical protein